MGIIAGKVASTTKGAGRSQGIAPFPCGEQQRYRKETACQFCRKSDYSVGVGGFGRAGRGAAGLTAVDDAGLAAGRAAGRDVGRAWGLATLKDLIFS